MLHGSLETIYCIYDGFSTANVPLVATGGNNCCNLQPDVQ